MSIRFRANPDIPDGVLDIVVEAREPSAQVVTTLKALESLGQRMAPTIAVETGTRIEIVRKTAIIAIEVRGESLDIRTLTQVFTTRERLYHILENLLAADFVQISRQVVINLGHLESLESSYSGNMVAKLTGGIHENVSRRYVAGLKTALGV